jgi:HTH-type transcriptional regulator/antitoxin HigA
MSTKSTKSTPQGPYLRLVRAFPLRPLRSDADLDAAVTVVDALVDRDELTEGEQDYLDVLSRLIEDYEDEHDPVPAMSGLEALRFLVQENGLSQAQLARETRIPVTTLSEILAGKRGISPKVRATLAERFKVAPTVFA